MKYYRFSRRRNDYFRYFRSKKKSDCIIMTGRSKILDSGSFDNQVWSALCKAWKGYVIAKNKDEYEKMERYARIIQESQHDLGLPISSFDNIGMSVTSFLNEDNNIQEEQTVSDEENYLTDSHYEQEEFTDTYSEYFQDDENKADKIILTFNSRMSQKENAKDNKCPYGPDRFHQYNALRIAWQDYYNLSKQQVLYRKIISHHKRLIRKLQDKLRKSITDFVMLEAFGLWFYKLNPE